MDPTLPCAGPALSHYIQPTTNHEGSKTCVMTRKRFEKSESEDSGVELPSPSPYGSESSYNPDESDSLESSTPEYPDCLDNPAHEYPEILDNATPEDPESLKSDIAENQDCLAQSEETVISEQPSLRNAGSFKMQDTETMKYVFTQHRERNKSGVPHKLEQAILRSKRQRSTYRDPIQNRAPRCNRQCLGSLKDQRRASTLSYQAKSPTCPNWENKDQDPLVLPGDGLRYLESLCQMLEQIAELKQKNQRLHQEKREAEGKLHEKEAEDRLHNQVLFLDACVCGTSRACRGNDLTDHPNPNEKIWEPKHYRKRSSSHAGVLLSIARPTDNGLRQVEKMDPQYVSVPNLQEGERQRQQRNYKPEASQWHKVKEMISKLSRKSSGPIYGSNQTVEPHKTYRKQTLLEGNPQQPRRLFLPGLVFRPRNHRQFL